MAKAADHSLPWPPGRRGAVSLTYDDGLDSQLDIAVPQLNLRQLRATFFLTETNVRNRLADWVAVGRAGHEIANHSVSHPCDISHAKPRRFVAHEVVAMERWIDANFGQGRPRTFAYPCDVTDLGPGSPNAQARRYAELLRRSGLIAARTSEGEPNSIHAASHHPYRLQGFALGYGGNGPAELSAYLERALREGRWAIIIVHELAAKIETEGQITADMHARLLDSILASSLWCAPMGEVFQRLKSEAPPRNSAVSSP
jgi:peptidoglycan/xylan/chitin deacetylase (PgdA/CDA1 family)